MARPSRHELRAERASLAGETRRELRVVESLDELAANASFWRVVGTRLTASEVRRHAFFRAIEIERMHEITSRATITNAPPGAEWYVSAVYVGRLYETHFWSTSSTITAEVLAVAPQGSLSLSAFAQQNGLQSDVRTLGLEPTSGDALFAASEREVRERYSASGEPRVIVVRYSRVPMSARPRHASAQARRVSLVSVSFPRRNPARNTSWDALGNEPEIRVVVTQGGGQLLEAFGEQDRRSTTFNDRPQLVGGSLTVTAERPLVFSFGDRDVAADDDAGSLTVTELQATDGRVQLQAESGVRIELDLQTPNLE